MTRNSKKCIRIGDRAVGINNPTYVICEIGNNHNGDYNRALEMVDHAKSMGANAVKFQMRNLEYVYRQKSLESKGDDLAVEYTIELLKKFELSFEKHLKISKHCKEIGITYLCTPWDTKSVEKLEEINVPAYKVSSADFTNIPLLDSILKTNKPIILSTGMVTEKEIIDITEYLNKRNAEFALLHCNSTYPTPLHHIQLNYLKRLSSIHSLVGYSGHERGIAISLAAIGLGAKIIERHFTLDKNLEGPDHSASLTKEEFSVLIDGIRDIDSALGSTEEKTLNQGELINRENLSKSIIAAKDLKVGHIIERDDLLVKSPGQGLAPNHIEKLIGITLKRDIEKDDYFHHSDILSKQASPRDYKFELDWGIPVRFHDFEKLHKMTNLKLVEFHFSYHDMELSLEKYLNGTYPIGFAVHAPELLKGSQLLDLTSEDSKIREFSISELQKVIDLTIKLKSYFPNQKNPLLITNIGGFSRDQKMTREERVKAYARLDDSLKQLKLHDIELIPQTMPPYPWHFGGQRFQNLFLDPEEIIKYCNELNLRICLDISHSGMASNFLGISFQNFLEKVSPYIAHIHASDYKGLDGEGLQIGEGQLNLPAVGDFLRRNCKEASFIPEIWQGHKNQGEGFWLALDRLESYL